MKKTRFFIFITALLITLLTVVGCDVSPVTPNSELVRASVSLGGNKEKGIVILDYAADVSEYRIALVPEWGKLENGTKPYGGFGEIDENGRIVGSYIERDPSEVSSIDLGYVTPGQWTIYVEAFNSSGTMLEKGSATQFFTKDSSNEAVVFLLPVGGEMGNLVFSISVQQLAITDATTKYILKYKIEGSNLIDPIYGTIPSTLIDNNRIHYSKTLELPQGDYLVTVSLVQNDGTESGKVIGGITRVVRVATKVSEHDYSYFGGDVTPQDFIPVEVNFSDPVVHAKLSSSFKGSKVKEGSIFSFTCEDTTNASEDATNSSSSDYNRKFIWYINGEKVLETTADAGTDISTFSDTSAFSKYGNYEVRCEIVYYTSNVSFIGGDSVKFQIIP